MDVIKIDQFHKTLSCRSRGSFLIVAVILTMAMLMVGLGLLKFISSNRMQMGKLHKISSERTVLHNLHQLIAREIASGHSDVAVTGPPDPFNTLRLAMNNFLYTNTFSDLKTNVGSIRGSGTNSFRFFDKYDGTGNNAINSNYTVIIDVEPDVAGNRDILPVLNEGRPMTFRTILLSYPLNYFQCALEPALGADENAVCGDINNDDGAIDDDGDTQLCLSGINWKSFFCRGDAKNSFRRVDVSDPFDFNSYPKKLVAQSAGFYFDSADIADIMADNPEVIKDTTLSTVVFLQEEFIITKEAYSDFALITRARDANGVLLTSAGKAVTVVGKVYLPGLDATAVGSIDTNFTFRDDNEVSTILTHDMTNPSVTVSAGATLGRGQVSPRALKRYNSVLGERLNLGTMDGVPTLADLNFNPGTVRDGTTGNGDWDGLMDLILEHTALDTESNDRYNEDVSPFNCNFLCEDDSCTFLSGDQDRECPYYNRSFASTPGEVPLLSKDIFTNGGNIAPVGIQSINAFSYDQTDFTDPVGGAGTIKTSLTMAAAYLALIGDRTLDESGIAPNPGNFSIFESVFLTGSSASISIASIPVNNFRLRLSCDYETADINPGTANADQADRVKFLSMMGKGTYCLYVDSDASGAEFAFTTRFRGLPLKLATLNHTMEERRNLLAGDSWKHYIEDNDNSISLLLTPTLLYYTGNARPYFFSGGTAGVSSLGNVLQYGYKIAGADASLVMKPWVIDNIYSAGAVNFHVKLEAGIGCAAAVTMATPPDLITCPDTNNFNVLHNSGLLNLDGVSAYINAFTMRTVKSILDQESNSQIVFGDQNSQVVNLRSTAGPISEIPYYLSRIGLEGEYADVKFIRLHRGMGLDDFSTEIPNFAVKSFGAIYDQGPITFIVEGDLEIDQPIHSYDESVRMGIIVTGDVDVRSAARRCTSIGNYCKCEQLDAFIMANSITFSQQNVDDIDVGASCRGGDKKIFIISGGLYAYNGIAFNGNGIEYEVRNSLQKGSFARPPGFGDTGVYNVNRVAPVVKRFHLENADIQNFIGNGTPIPYSTLEDY